MGLRTRKTGKPRNLINLLVEVATIIFISFSVLSCGYTLGGFEAGSKTMRKGAISIGKFRNDTNVRDAAIILGEKIKDELNKNGYRWDFSTSGRYLIRGKVISIYERPVGFTEQRYGLEYTLDCSVDIEVLETASGAVAMKLDRISNTSTYYAGDDPTYTRTNRDLAVEAVMGKIAERFVILLNEL